MRRKETREKEERTPRENSPFSLSSYILLSCTMRRVNVGVYLVGRNKAQIRVTVGTDRESRTENWAENGRAKGYRSASSYRAAGRAGGHFEVVVFFTTINNPERTSFRDTGESSRERKGRGGERCDNSFLGASIVTCPPPSLFFFVSVMRLFPRVILALRRAISTWGLMSAREHVGHEGIYTTYFETRRSNVSTLVGAGRSVDRDYGSPTEFATLPGAPIGLPGYTTGGPPARKSRRIPLVIYPKWSALIHG